MGLADLQAKAGKLAPMVSLAADPIEGRTLYIDGDCLAYSCAGSEGTSREESKARVNSLIGMFQAASQSSEVHILLTGSGSHKGHRYAIARTRTYQGHRAGAKKPANWRYLRDLLEAGVFGKTTLDYDREADDRFGQYGHADPENTVIATLDKDMRMVPGYHLNWDDRRMFYLEPGRFHAVHAEKQYGMRWFWLQMLHGDTADMIPGLPRFMGKPCGPVASEKILLGATTSQQAARHVKEAYESTYGSEWFTELAEQACLLWMRHTPEAGWDDAFADGGPLSTLMEECPIKAALAHAALSRRVQQAKEINELANQTLAASSVEG